MTYMRAIFREEGSPLFFCGLVSRRNSAHPINQGENSLILYKICTFAP